MQREKYGLDCEVLFWDKIAKHSVGLPPLNVTALHSTPGITSPTTRDKYDPKTDLLGMRRGCAAKAFQTIPSSPAQNAEPGLQQGNEIK